MYWVLQGGGNTHKKIKRKKRTFTIRTAGCYDILLRKRKLVGIVDEHLQGRTVGNGPEITPRMGGRNKTDFDLRVKKELGRTSGEE